MTNQEILTKAIEKAIAGGWKHQGITDEGEMHFGDSGVVVDWLRGGQDYMSVGDLMLDHDFAKALWGEELSDDFVMFPDGEDYGEVWKYHLQQMVIADDPIKYLGENI